MNNKRIAIVCANKLRDLDGLVYLKILLENKGHTVKIFNFGGHTNFNDMANFKPHVFIFSTVLEKNMTKFSRALKKAGTKIIELRTEGITSKFLEDLGTSKYIDISYLDAQIVWGEKLKRLLLKNSNVPKEKVFVCGCIRMDFYKFNGRFLKKKEFQEKHHLNSNKIISYATGFSLADCSNEEINKISNKRDVDFFRYANLMKTFRKKAYKFIIQLSKDFPEVNFIIKVHPYEKKEYYIQNKPENLSNLLILQEEKINNVINVSEVYIHSNSVSSLEAWFKKIPTICLYPKKDFGTLIDAIAGGDHIEDYGKLKQKISKYLSGEPISKKILNLRNKFIQDHLYKIDGKSTERTVEVVDRIAKKAGKVKKPNMPIFLNLQKIKLLIRKILDVPDNRSLFFFKKHNKYYNLIANSKEIQDTEKNIKSLITSKV